MCRYKSEGWFDRAHPGAFDLPFLRLQRLPPPTTECCKRSVIPGMYHEVGVTVYLTGHQRQNRPNQRAKNNLGVVPRSHLSVFDPPFRLQRLPTRQRSDCFPLLRRRRRRGPCPQRSEALWKPSGGAKQGKARGSDDGGALRSCLMFHIGTIIDSDPIKAWKPDIRRQTIRYLHITKSLVCSGAKRCGNLR